MSDMMCVPYVWTRPCVCVFPCQQSTAQPLCGDGTCGSVTELESEEATLIK